MKWKFALCITLLFCGTLSEGKNRKKKKNASKMDLLRLAKQLTMQQFYVEESTRANGHSGIKVMRHRSEGTQPYHGTSHADLFTMGSTHDHSDFFNTCGMGEIAAVLNGVHFTTRHNDYLLVRKADNYGRLPAYNATVPIPYPDVPPSVLNKATLQKQIKEMRKFFKAFAQQDTSIRDYRPYFKAHLCYMEGTWTDSDPDDIQEAFDSERHFYDAFSWNDLFQKKRFESASGTKTNLENFAFMPTTLWDVKDDGTLVFGQWNYKILCHQLKDDLPLNRLRAVDDLKTRMALQVDYDEAQTLRNARYQINPYDIDTWFDGPSKWGFLDKLMEQIPGPDGYGAHLTDVAFDNLIKRFDTPDSDSTPLNVNHYHRWYQNLESGAMGIKVRHRGFSDENMWVAMTTQPNVLASRLETCDRLTQENCQSWEQKWVYAMPMEIIYTTPLMNWNPHDIKYKGLSTEPDGQTVLQGPSGNRDGSMSLDKAFDGANSAKFYRTPWDFFQGNEFGDDPADTPADFAYALNEAGSEMFKVRSSGIRTFMPTIPGIGRIRQRYPVHTIHGEGGPVWKELSALKEVVMNPAKYDFILRKDPPTSDKPLLLTLGSSTSSSQHSHVVILSQAEQNILLGGSTVQVVTSNDNGHTHTLVLERTALNGVVIFKYLTCSSLPLCPDGHPPKLF